MEFLVTLTTVPPAGTSEAEIDTMRAREAERDAALAAEGKLLRLWRPPLKPGEWKALGLWQAASEAELRDALSTLALYPWFDAIEIMPLTPHPADPHR